MINIPSVRHRQPARARTGRRPRPFCLSPPRRCRVRFNVRASFIPPIGVPGKSGNASSLITADPPAPDCRAFFSFPAFDD
ncbi:hypothetical protein EVAR_45907_1 [Eumeta japonica]|uniref:Uncharacterized protein n=1 Tax=Eumeta variegata TaxID=151549 RepID=A0A4C1XPX8_EUMVA|nr:hypothetical protein EVAR_45907_1 [Eumeta japonica]